ncbi:PREDICTED: uncharacterized protein LOC106857494 [Sturnus vulgaris]|uniref:uncharacterized protein LOC106857494 n=1 Tax=Sturnus vulgaris TaxID=9172 RepID=UPI00071A6710|nr:PREDICTED: uncharacterized protein LOC106857494 [Sturnus vulgaris]
MGGIFGKNKRPCVFPRVVYRAKGRKGARVCCDAATWTGDTHFHSARIGRALRGFEPPEASMVLEASESEFREEEGDSASCPWAQHSEISVLVIAGDAAGAEPGAKPQRELQKHKGQGPQSPEESREAEAVLHPPELLSGEPGVTPLTQITVEVDVHVSAGDPGEPGQDQAAAKCELLRGAQQQEEAGAGRGAEQEGEDEDACVGKALWEVPMQKAGDTTAASCPLEEPELPLKAAEPGESITNGQRAAQEQGGEETEAPPDLQLGEDEIAAPEGVKGTAGGAEQDQEMPETCGDEQTAEETPARLPETREEQKPQVSSEGKAEEH